MKDFKKLIGRKVMYSERENILFTVASVKKITDQKTLIAFSDGVLANLNDKFWNTDLDLIKDDKDTLVDGWLFLKEQGNSDKKNEKLYGLIQVGTKDEEAMKLYKSLTESEIDSFKDYVFEIASSDLSGQALEDENGDKLDRDGLFEAMFGYRLQESSAETFEDLLSDETTLDYLQWEAIKKAFTEDEIIFIAKLVKDSIFDRSTEIAENLDDKIQRFLQQDAPQKPAITLEFFFESIKDITDEFAEQMKEEIPREQKKEKTSIINIYDGDIVKVISGEFAGIQGEVIEVKDGYYIVETSGGIKAKTEFHNLLKTNQ